jgi:hypothetical protein
MTEKHNIKNIHLVLYSNGEPFTSVKLKTIESIQSFTTKNVIIHDYNLEKIMKLSWFPCIEYLPKMHFYGARDGYYNSWKAFITHDVYNEMGDDDILYYVDSSQHYQMGFTENIDNLCEYAFHTGCVAGSVSDNGLNSTDNYCNNLIVWDSIIPPNNYLDNQQFLNKMHVLNSWFLFKKNETNTKFMDEWIYFSVLTKPENFHDSLLNNYTFERPLITYHHTADQSIFSILVYKYNLPVFYSKSIEHGFNKNKNLVLKTVNQQFPYDSFFIKLM